MTRELVEMSLAEQREVQLGILDQVDRFCRDHGLRYYLWAGTLLGGVRHGGYIPWDDDIDIAMPRPDYEQFCREFPSADTELRLHTMTTDLAYGLPFAKVADPRTALTDEYRASVPIGVNVDVFPLDSWPDERLSNRAYRAALRLLHTAMKGWDLPPGAGRTRLRRLVVRVGRHTLARLPLRWYTAPIAQVARLGRGTREVGVTVFRYLERIDAAAYGEPVPVDFEGRKFPAPADADAVLWNLYGDYWQLPPEPERVPKHQATVVWVS